MKRAICAGVPVALMLVLASAAPGGVMVGAGTLHVSDGPTVNFTAPPASTGGTASTSISQFGAQSITTQVFIAGSATSVGSLEGPARGSGGGGNATVTEDIWQLCSASITGMHAGHAGQFSMSVLLTDPSGSRPMHVGFGTSDPTRQGFYLAPGT